MIEGVGVCSICAKVCHRGHDVTYAKFGNFFCDCGAKENNYCKVYNFNFLEISYNSSSSESFTQIIF